MRKLSRALRSGARRSGARRFGARRFGAMAAAGLVGVVLAAALAGWLVLRASLPRLDGRTARTGVQAEVRVSRDAVGVPTITAQNRGDLAFALGYLHAQDRFFQMDLLRRAAAGELAALLGPALLPADRELRRHRFRDVAERAVASLDAPSRALLDAYANGANAGLSALRARPFEYWLLRAEPRPWRPVDTVLCAHAMFLQLQDPTGHLQLQRGLLRATLPEALWRFIEAGAPEWDAAIDGSQSEPPRIPTPEEIDLRSLGALPVAPPETSEHSADPAGSNNWAVAGSRTADGAALVANDMHLGLRVPNTWYRARLVQASADGFDEIGLTLPGTPSLIAGSNGHIAWGFTNSYGEFAKVIRLAPVPGDPDAYATVGGTRKLSYVDEIIEVKGAPSEHLKVAITPWGPVMGTDWQHRPYALDWVAHDPAAVNIKLLALEHIHSAAEALRAAGDFGMPGQNILVGDAEGHIGWSIAGRLPRHRDAPPVVPQLSTDSAVGFEGWLAPAERPQVLDPAEGLLWSANARVVGGEAASRIGDDGMDRGARAAQIHADLQEAAPPLAPLTSLRIELDDRALFLERWRALLGQAIESAPDKRSAAAARAVLVRWSGHAAPNDPAFRLTVAFRHEVEARVFYMLVAPARLADREFNFEIPPSFEGPLWRLLQARPVHMLAAAYADWDTLLDEAFVASTRLPRECASEHMDLASCTWGRVNAVRIAHPLSAALPLLRGLLDMPTVGPPGAHDDMPRIQGTDFGASERFSVSPGHERDAYLHMPGGQSGHPLSPFYRAGFDAWVEGRPTALLPGPATHELVLMP
jgi:penicillin amidase